MSNAITRCPKCHTSFRVTEEILSSAHGSVRCGSCLMIFNARENLLADETSADDAHQQTGETSESSTNADQSAVNTFSDPDDELIHDDALIDSDSDDNDIDADTKIDDDFDENIFVANHASRADINLFERRIKDEDNRELENADHDEAWALSLLEDDDDEDLESEEKSTRSNPFLIIEEDEEKGDYDADSGLNTANQETFESDIFDTNLPSDTDSEDLDLELEEDQHEHFEDEYEEQEYYDDERAYESSRTDFLEAIEPEPLELSVPQRPQLLQSSGFWFGASAFAAAVLVLQLAYFNFDNFSRHETMRPYYKTACGLIGCSLPALVDLNKLKVQNMVVMDHPESGDMLLVDATIINQADFEQVFPVLQLTFTDIANKVVSKMLFNPETYVGGELSGRKLMPAKHPIHITLELQDPGEDALNYQIAVVKP